MGRELQTGGEWTSARPAMISSEDSHRRPRDNHGSYYDQSVARPFNRGREDAEACPQRKQSSVRPISVSAHAREDPYLLLRTTAITTAIIHTTGLPDPPIVEVRMPNLVRNASGAR
jgi:hypothetical protein